ncbi:hypothetical protein NDU88_003199 [Pleurodeles waltl]|uniref:Uncharacterized protein n=1 Tax=Pleurodeles waltl TaxID=8319 RepID=A0AAV7W432_PLEWA|nr:hypothetical protein NDU88_003199 [Pleurodeles waltl]
MCFLGHAAREDMLKRGPQRCWRSDTQSGSPTEARRRDAVVEHGVTLGPLPEAPGKDGKQYQEGKLGKRRDREHEMCFLGHAAREDMLKRLQLEEGTPR